MRNQRGFTLVELAVVTSIIVTLLGFITINLIRSQQGASLTSVEEILLADLKQQQIKAMIGDTEGRVTSDSYGIHFDLHQYILFHGPTYLQSDSANSTTPLPNNIQFDSVNLDIVFSKISGEIPAVASVVLEDTTNGNEKTITINRYGVVTQVQ